MSKYKLTFALLLFSVLILAGPESYYYDGGDKTPKHDGDANMAGLIVAMLLLSPIFIAMGQVYITEYYKRLRERYGRK